MGTFYATRLPGARLCRTRALTESPVHVTEYYEVLVPAIGLLACCAKLKEATGSGRTSQLSESFLRARDEDFQLLCPWNTALCEVFRSAPFAVKCGEDFAQ
jgi:hypothetical protein